MRLLRWLALLGLTGVGLVTVLSQPEITRALTERGWPGTETHAPEDLDPAFRRCLDGLLDAMQAAGWRPVLRATWRDQARQAWYQRSGSSQISNSLHQVNGAGGRPASLAADLVQGWPLWLVPVHARFYLDLRAKADASGLITGGTWSRTSWVWAPFDLGWDPGHVQGKPGRCGR